MHASRQEGLDVWKITRYNGPHTCSNPAISKDHYKLDSKIICHFIMPLVEQQPSVKISALQAECKDKIGYELSYRKTWKARHIAIVKIYGGWEESYGRLRRLMITLCKQNPGSPVLIEDDELFIDNHLVLGYKVFDRMFWSFKQLIEGFKHCRPIICIDSTFLYGKYKGCLFCATALDGNNHIFPIAWAIVDCEDGRNWDWFMKCLRVFVTDREDICVISDRHKGIIKAMQDDWWQPPTAHHRFCIRHSLSNYNTKFKNSVMKDALCKAAHQNQKKKFYEAMYKIRDMHQETYDWAVKIDSQKWTRSHDGGKRYGSMTTNTIESMNGMLKGLRALPITAMLERTLKCYELMFHALGDEVYWPESNGDPLVPDSTRKRQKGRPMSSRRNNKMNWMLKGKLRERSTIYCSICREPGHNRQSCPIKNVDR
ncbi:uncharacterized protein LOC110650051 [Hevea brasiliensis]|uniref:uncharacterized protein LOC110650051 n=1 Tax=Hevea brasiliensis TaxID=3981 RepID=UPI0025EB51B0|nr:uncharacterized protein LOC110650051 [Hevea brasiliensis]